MPTSDPNIAGGSKGLAFVKLARPHQYTKNLFVFLPAFFGGSIVSSNAFGPLCAVFVAFCLLASAVYSLNDVLDRKEDLNHPVKRFRPVASGLVGVRQALFFSGGLSFVAASVILFLGNWMVAMAAGAYLVLNLGYCFGFKHRALIDVSCIAAGFLLRVLAGSFAAGVSISHWLILMTYLLAMFLALGKRWDDLRIVGENGQSDIRKSLDGYSPEFVSTAMVVMASVNLVAYIMYTTSDAVVSYYGTNSVYLTAFWVITGFLRYMQVTLVEHGAGSPARVLLNDRFIQVVVGGWLVHLSSLLYFR